jgi:Methyltransferase domain
MLDQFKKTIKIAVRKMGFRYPSIDFHSNEYLRHNARRLEHLASLRIPVSGMTVLEVGAGIGDHSNYYLDRDCRITITEVRLENIKKLKERYPGCNIQQLDMDAPSQVQGSPFEVVHCYGLLYHLSQPKRALEFLSKNTSKILFLETCVSFGEEEAINLVEEPQSNPTQAYSGTGCRPTRKWIFSELKNHFKYVYIPTTQPCHEQFPLDWNISDKHSSYLQRAVFIASREPITNDKLTSSLITKQTRHE